MEVLTATFRDGAKNADGCIPVIDRQHVLALLYQFQHAMKQALKLQ